ncbi:MAG: GrpB family protein [Pseudomonadota bacterium]
MSLTSDITSYNPEWPALYADEVVRIAPIFGQSLIQIYHVGSTAVPGLSAKPEIDLLVVVAADEALDEWTASIRKLGYKRGGDLSRGHHFFRRNVNGIRTHKAHVCIEQHPQIARMLKFRDHLRSHPEMRNEYQSLKLKLEEENTEGIGEYLEGKAPFIDRVLSSLD